MTKYTTIQGDTWDLIALKMLGSEKYKTILIENNLQYKDIVIFSAEIVLNIPEVEIEKVTTDLPPWKK